MRVGAPEDVYTTGTTSTGEKRQSRIMKIKKGDKKMLNPTLMISCNLLKLLFIGDAVTNKKRIQ